MTPALWVAIAVAVLGASSGVVAAVLGRRTAAEDGPHARLLAEVRYLADELKVERERGDRLEAEVRSCHAERARDRAETTDRLRDLERQVAALTPGGTP